MAKRYLYKYVSFDPELHVLKIITEYSIKFSSVDAFNDPFDCSPNYVAGKNPLKELPKLFKRVEGSGSPATRLMNRQRASNRLAKAFDDGSFDKGALAHVGIVSLTRNPWNILMWSHYANKHQGFLVEFQEPEYFSNSDDASDHSWLVTFPVEYVADRPKIARMNHQQNADVDKVFLHKAEEWKYEEEERVIKYLGGPGVFKYKPQLLTSVVAGCNISSPNLKLLKSAVDMVNRQHGRSISFYKAELDRAEYKLNIPGFNRLRAAAGSLGR